MTVGDIVWVFLALVVVLYTIWSAYHEALDRRQAREAIERWQRREAQEARRIASTVDPLPASKPLDVRAALRRDRRSRP